MMRLFFLTTAVLLAQILPAQNKNELPDAVRSLLRKGYDPADLATVRYMSAHADLNGDGKPEVLVYLVNRVDCGSGGCPLLVFTPSETSYRLVTRTSVTQTPIRLSSRSSHGWRTLVVGVGGGGRRSGNVELRFDGKSYPKNPTVVPATPVRDLAGTTLLIDNGTFEQMAPLGTGK